MLPDKVLHLRKKRVSLLGTDGVPGHYAALSYCRGNSQPLATMKAILSAHKEDIPWANMSSAFQDAIIVAQNLGLDYFWIDSLSILQDSAADKLSQITKMDQIYSKAHFTIAAVSSTSPNSGLFSADHACHSTTEIKPYNLYSRQRIPHASHLLSGAPGDDPLTNSHFFAEPR